MDTKKITVVGNGQIGQALIYLLNKSGNKYIIEIYDKDETKNESHKTLKECLVASDFVFLCIPSWFLKETLIEVSNCITSETILISISKGLNANSCESVDQMIEENAKNNKYALLSGPMFAKEILKDKMSFGVLASKNKEVFEEIAALFKNTKLKLEYSKKVRAVALSGVLKNVYTLVISIIDSSLEDNNVKGYFSARAVKEMQEIMGMLWLDKKIILSTSGLGDFVATVSSEHSQNRKVGTDISTTGKTSLKSEGLVSLPPLIKIIGKKYTRLPMLCMLERIIIEGKDSKTEINNFLKEIS